MNLFRAGRESVEPAGDAVVETRTDADHQVAIVHRPVRFPRAVHAEHAEPLRIGRRIRAEPHERRGDRKAGKLHNLAQEHRRLGARIDDAAASVEQRTLRIPHQFDRGLDLLDVALDLRAIGLVLDIARPDVVAFRELDVFRDVDHHRSRAAVRRDIECFVDHARKIGDVLHEIIVFRAGARDADRVALLECVVADEVCRHLTGDHDDRDRIHQRVGETGNRVGRTRTRRHEHRADLARRARVTFCRVHGTLLVPHEDVAELLLLEQRVVDRQHRAARVAENVLDALIDERLDHHLRPGHFRLHRPAPSFPRFRYLTDPSESKRPKEKGPWGPFARLPKQPVGRPRRRASLLR